MTIDELLERVERDLDVARAGGGATQEAASKSARSGSRYVGPNADPSLVEHVAAGGSIKTAEPVSASWSAGAKGLGAVMTKALAEGTGSAGGYLVAPEVSADVVRMLRARSAVMRLGPTIVPVAKELSVTSLSAGATAYYVAENAPIPPSEETLAQSPLLRPKELAALVPISNRLLRDAAESPSVEQVIRSDLAEIMSLRSDLAALRGTGTGGEPLGIRNHSGLTAAPSLGTDGGTPDYDDLMDMLGALRSANAPFERPGWIFHPRSLTTLAKLKDTTGNYLAESGLLTYDRQGGGGTLLGFPFVTSTQVPINLTTGANNDTSEIYFTSDAQEMWVGENDELVIEASRDATYTTDGGTTWVSAYQSRQHVFRATLAHDFALRRPQLFSILQGVRP